MAVVGTKGADKAVKLIKSIVQKKKGGVQVIDSSNGNIEAGGFKNQIDKELKKHGISNNHFNELKL